MAEEYYYSAFESDYNSSDIYDFNEYIENWGTENTKKDASRVFLVRTFSKLIFF